MVRFLDSVVSPFKYLMTEAVILILVFVILAVAVAFIVKFVILRKYRQEKFLEEILGDLEEDK